MSDVRFLSNEQVQFFLDQLDTLERFSVIFMKKNGEQRRITGYLDPNGQTRKVNVPVQTDEKKDENDSGWRSFNLDRVLFISKV